MTQFLRRLIGALTLDAGVYEDIESDRHAAMQSVAVVAAVSVAGGIAWTGLGLDVVAFISGAIIALGAWLVWAATIAALGRSAMAEPQTRIDVPQLLRVLGYAAAPGMFLVLAAMRAVAAPVLILVSVWLVAAGVMAVRQALDYRSTTRAVLVCAASLLIAAGTLAGFAVLFTRTLN